MPSEQEPKTELPPIPEEAPKPALVDVPAKPDPVEALEKEKQKEKQKSSLAFKKILRSYLLPLAVLAIFAGLLIFLVIPKISTILDQLDQTNTQYDKARAQDAEILVLNNLTAQSDVFQANLNLINQIAPSGATEVVNFQKKILAMAAESNLTVQQSTLQESVKTTEDKTSVSNLGIIEIPSTFALKGTFTDVKAFVLKIHSLADFVIIGEMALNSNIDSNSANTDPDEWSLVITLIKYQFLEPNAQNQLAALFANVSPQAQINQQVINFAANKFATTDTTTNSGDSSTTDQTGN